MRRVMIILLCIAVVLTLLICLSQVFAHTPKITDENGKEIAGSIAELKKIELNGRKEWITIRGCNQSAPIILFLAGGPGGSQLAATRMKLSELEKDFLIVNWDQPGSGKSSNCMKRSEITVSTYIEDGIALAEYLRERFGQEKIYLIGESWGSALGVFMADAKPEYFAGIIGTGQMVDFVETDKLDYEKAMELALAYGDTKIAEKLTKQGPPPYYDGNIALKTTSIMNYLSMEMSRNPNTASGAFNTLAEMTASEYGAVDTLNYFLGLMNTFNVFYPQLYEVDLRNDYSKIDVPVYFFLGRHDINAPTSLVEDYYDILSAPQKEIVWFERSGHTPWTYETDLFIQETRRVFAQ